MRPKSLIAAGALFVSACSWGEARILRLAASAAGDGVVCVDCYATGVADVRKVRADVLKDGVVCATAESPARFTPSNWRAESVLQPLEVSVHKPSLWTPETPTLYGLRVSLLSSGGGVLGACSTRVGFRTVEMRNGLRVNGRSVRLKGVICRPTVTPCVRDHVIALKALGANAVRFADGAPQPEFLDACDELGLYVVDELPPNAASTVDDIVAVRVTRDVSHPSVIMWAHPPAPPTRALHCDDAFAAWDVQRRPVIHPGCRDDVLNCPENMEWAQLRDALKGSVPVLATSVLPASGAGGLAAGFADYWQLFRASSGGIGCFIGELTDYVTFDLQKRAAFDAVRDVWTPVSCTYADGYLTFRNAFDFVNLGTCVYTWTALSWKSGSERRIAAARVVCPPCPAGETVRAPSPSLPPGTEALEISVADRDGIEVSRTRFRMAWSPLAPTGRASAPPDWIAPPRFVTLAFSNAVQKIDGRTVHTSVFLPDPLLQKGFTCFWQKLDARTYRLDYTCSCRGAVAAAGVTFDVAESCVKSKTWFGRGPGTAWANRLTGGQLGRWTSSTRGFFTDGEWLELDTTAGRVRITVLSGPSILGLYPAGDTAVPPLYEFPELLGVGVWSRLPALGNGACDVRRLGPSSSVLYVSQEISGSLLISYDLARSR